MSKNVTDKYSYTKKYQEYDMLDWVYYTTPILSALQYYSFRLELKKTYFKFYYGKL